MVNMHFMIVLIVPKSHLPIFGKFSCQFEHVVKLLYIVNYDLLSNITFVVKICVFIVDIRLEEWHRVFLKRVTQRQLQNVATYPSTGGRGEIK